MSSAKIQSIHQERMAYVYVRQSTPHQVIEHRESTERQYNLRERALGLGWTPGRVKSLMKIRGAPAAHQLIVLDSSDWSPK